MLLLCLGVAAPLMAIGCFSLWKEYQTLKQEAGRATTFQAAIAVRTMTNWTRSQLDTIKAVASLSALKESDPQAIKAILDTALDAEPSWNELLLLSAEGKPLVGSQRNKREAFQADKVSLDRVSQAFVDGLVASRQASISDYCRSPISGKAAILAAAPIVQGDKTKALLLASIEPKAVLDLFSGLGAHTGTVIAVIDNKKRVVARTLQNDYWQGKDFSKAKTVRAAAKSVRGNIEVVGIADPTPRAYAYDHVPKTNWLLVVGVPTSDIYGEAHDWLALMSAFAACAIGVSVVLALWATLHFTKSIHVLVREALAVGRGDFTKRVHVPARDELGLLARAFNQMASRLQINHEMKTMIEGISESIRRSLDLDQILNTTVSELGAALNASRCCLALVDTHFTQDTS
ncbi:MAG TPA: HAMP domain-containing protein, partial [Candidatus Obscuribacterales bacterium]